MHVHCSNQWVGYEGAGLGRVGGCGVRGLGWVGLVGVV